MQCGELVYRKVNIMTQGSDSEDNRQKKPEKETIHSGHFMVSHFEAEAQDDEYDVAVPVPGEDSKLVNVPSNDETTETFVSLNHIEKTTQVSIETSLTKLFQCMSLAYRQKLTSPRWNRFKGIRLRWKDKIRLNNVIWRCWHMQFIMKQNTMVCQFASPLDVDTHNKPEAVVLEGKYWKRRLGALSAEYKKWRMFYRNRTLGWASKDSPDMLSTDMDMFDWQPHSNDSSSMYPMMVDEDYMEFMSDTLFSTIQSNQPFAFPDPREIARGAGLADFIQPSLVQLQPNLDDFMDTLEPLQDLVLSQHMKLPSVPEECVVDDLYRSTPRTNSVSAFSGMLDNQTSSPLQVPLNQQQVRKQQQHLQQLQQTPQLPQTQQLQQTPQLQQTQQLQQPSQLQQTRQLQQPSQLQQTSQLQQQHTLASHQVSPQPPPQSQQNLQYSASIFAQPDVSSYSSPRNLVTRSDNFAQGSALTEGIIFEEPAQIPGNLSTPIASVPPNTASGRRITPSTQRSSENHLVSQQRQEQQQRSTPESAVAALFQREPVQQPIVVSPSPQSPSQSSPNSVNSYQTVTPASLSPSSVQQSQPFSGQQTYTVSAQPSPPAQVSEYKPYSANSPPSLPTVADPTLSASVSPVRRHTSVRSNSLTSEDDFFAVPKQYNKHKLRTRSGSGQSLVPAPAQRQHPPPLVSRNSDSSIPTVTNSTLQPLLAHLLSNNSSQVFKFGTDTFKNQQVMPILPMPYQGVPNSTNHGSGHNAVPQTTTALLITTPGTIAPMSPLPTSSTPQNNNSNHLLLNSLATGRKNSYSPDSSSSVTFGICSVPSQNIAMAPPKPVRIRPDSASQLNRRPDSTLPKEHRRECHTKAEHKRRCNIKNGFDMLHSLIPQLHQNPNAKLSKAAMLQKGADYIQQLRAERDILREEMQDLKQEIESLNQSISNCQSMLPATGAPVSRQRASKMREMFDEYVRVRTLENWKFWIFSILVEPLLTSYNSSVSTASFEDLYRSTLNWVEQHCSLVDLRPAVLNSLRYLSTATEILTDPSKLPSEARRAVHKQDRQQ